MQLMQCSCSGHTDAIEIHACVQVSAVLITWLECFPWVCVPLFVSHRSKPVRVMVTVSVNNSNCLNKVYIAVTDNFPVRILE